MCSVNIHKSCKRLNLYKFVNPFRNTKTEITDVSGSNNVINPPAPVLETEPNLKDRISKAKLVRSYSFLSQFTCTGIMFQYCDVLLFHQLCHIS